MNQNKHICGGNTPKSAHNNMAAEIGLPNKSKHSKGWQPPKPRNARKKRK